MTRDMLCPNCGHRVERIAIGMTEPDRTCEFCETQMNLLPTFPAGVKYIGAGFHVNEYPLSSAEKMKQYGLERHDSTRDHSDYHEDDYDGS